MKCPNCGKPMQIIRENSNGNYARVWRCPDWIRFGSDPCYTVIPIQGDEQLTIPTIAEDMAMQAFTNSDEQGKKQSNYRRIAGSLTKLNEGRKYLSDDELKILTDAAEILQRLGTAAEKAKKAKLRLEEEEKHRVQIREKAVRETIDRQFTSDDLVELATMTLALHNVTNRPDPWRNGWIKRIRQSPYASRELMGDIKREINSEYEDILSESIGLLSYRHQPVDELVKELSEKVTEKIRDYTSSTVIEELKEALAIEVTPNVVSLPRKLS